MRQSSKITLLVDDALMPSLSSFLPNDSPGAPFGTMKALMPLCFLALSVVANTTKPSACQLKMSAWCRPVRNIIKLCRGGHVEPSKIEYWNWKKGYLTSEVVQERANLDLLVIQDLVPLRSQPSGTFLAVVEAAPASLPTQNPEENNWHQNWFYWSK